MTANQRTLILTGPTAVGKSSFAIEAAQLLQQKIDVQLEIINADSVAFYQEFNIGSAKPSKSDQAAVPHHLLDIAHPNSNYHAGDFLKDCSQAITEIHQRGNRALIVGGSGFYLKALLLGLWDAPPTSEAFRKTLENDSLSDLSERLKKTDPEHAEKIGSQDRYRIIRALEVFELSGKTPSALQKEMPQEKNPAFEFWVIDRAAETLHERIAIRVQNMLEQGLVDEVVSLIERFPKSKTLNAVGYQQVVNHLQGVVPQGRTPKPGLIGLADEIALAHRQLVKQQRTWFKNLDPSQVFVFEEDHTIAIEKLMRFYQ